MSIKVSSASCAPSAFSPVVPSISALVLLVLSILRGVGGASAPGGLMNRATLLPVNSHWGKRGIGDEFAIISAPGDQYDSTTEGLDEGFITVYETSAPGPYADTCAQLFDDLVNPVGGVFKVADNASVNNVANCATKLPGGGFAIGWSQNNGSNIPGGAFYRRFSAFSQTGGKEVQANISPLNGQSITINSLNGSAVALTYSAVAATPYLQGLYFSAEDAAIGNFTAAGTSGPYARGLSTGNFATCSVLNFDGTEIYLTVTEPYENQPYTGETVASLMNPSNCKHAETGGGFVVVFQSAGQNGNGSDVYGVKYLLSGPKNGTSFLINTNTNGTQGSPSMVGWPAGFFVVYECFNPNTQSFDVCGQDFDASTQKLNQELVINIEPTGITMPNKVRPSVALFANLTKAIVTWTSAANGTMGLDIRGMIFSVTDSGLVPTLRLPSSITTSPSAATLPPRSSQMSTFTSTASQPQRSTSSSLATSSFTSARTSSQGASPSSSSAMATSGSSSPPLSPHASASNTGLFVGIAAAVAVVAYVILAGGIVFCRRKRRQQEAANFAPVSSLSTNFRSFRNNDIPLQARSSSQAESHYVSSQIDTPYQGKVFYGVARPEQQGYGIVQPRSEPQYDIPEPREALYDVPQMGGVSQNQPHYNAAEFAPVEGMPVYPVANTEHRPARNPYEAPESNLTF